MPKDYYAVLGLPRTAPDKEIRAAYRKLAAQYHPDKVAGDSADVQAESTTRMVELNQAVAVLGNVAKRSQYDRDLQSTLTAASTRKRGVRTPSEPMSKETAVPVRAPQSDPPPSPINPGIEKRVKALRIRIRNVPLIWNNLSLPQWNWSIEGSGSGRPVLIVHKHVDSLEVNHIRPLEKAIDQLLDQRKEVLRSPLIILLLTTRRMINATQVATQLDALAKRGRGWLKKKPLIVLYAEDSRRILRFGEVPKGDQTDAILNLLLHP